MPFEIVRNDITKMSVDAIVNAANSALAPGGGVCGAIFAAAGYDQLDRACRAIGHCDVGQAVITDGFHLPAKYVIHAVGPIWRGGGQNEAALLKSCYINSLRLAEENGCQSIAFPLISSGIYGYPKAEALKIAVSAIGEFLLEHEMQVYLAIFDRNALLLSETCSKVYLIHRRDSFRGEAKLVDALKAKDNVEFILGARITELVGEDELCGLKLDCNGETRNIDVTGLFVAIGHAPDNGKFSSLIALTEAGYADSGEDCLTPAAGVFAAGDCRAKEVRQLTTACADGAVAALAACKYCESL